MGNILFVIVFSFSGFIVSRGDAQAGTAGSSVRHSGPGIFVRDGRISLDVKDADVFQVIGEIAMKTGTSINLGKGVGGKITAKFENKTLEETLRKLFDSSALVYEFLPETQTYRVVQADTFTGKAGLNRESAIPGPVSAQNKPWPPVGSSPSANNPSGHIAPGHTGIELDSRGRQHRIHHQQNGDLRHA